MVTPAGKKLVAALGAKLAPLGPFQARPMFGGFGLYIDGLIFGLMISDQVFLKVDDQNRAAFETARCEPFCFAAARGETTITSYWRCPEAVLRNATMLQLWVTGALAASRRAQMKKTARKKTAHKGTTHKKTAHKKTGDKPTRQRNPFL
jgi:DNA transformation protein